MDTDANDRGESLRFRRLEAGLTVNQLAGLAGCSSSTIERLEGGVRPRYSPTTTRLYAAIDAYVRDADASS